MVITIEDPVLAPVVPVDDEVDLLTELWMERVRDADRTGHLNCAACR